MGGISGESRSISIINSEITRGTHSVKIHGDNFQEFNGDNFKSVRTLVQKTVLDATLTLHKYLNFFPFSSFNYESPELTFIIPCRNLIKYIPTFMLLKINFFFNFLDKRSLKEQTQ